MIMLNSSSQVLQWAKLQLITNWPINLSTGLVYGLFTLRLQNNSSVQDICLYRCLTAYRVGYLVNFWSDMTCTGVSSSPPLEILPLEYMAVLESKLKPISKCVVCEEREENLYLSLTKIQIFSECVTFPFNHTCCMHLSNSMTIVNVSNYDHVEQFISSSAMSKAAADNKSPDKSVNRLPYGLLP